MKLILAAAISLIACAAHAKDQVEILPTSIFQPAGKGDGSYWTVSFTPSYLDENRKDVTQPTVTFNVASGKCVLGASNVVSMKGNFSAKVTQKICVGQVDGKNVIVGWLVAPGAEPKPFTGEAETEYGVGIHFVFDGNYLEADQSIYKFKATKQTGSTKSAS
jgi:hypothetical protein